MRLALGLVFAAGCVTAGGPLSVKQFQIAPLPVIASQKSDAPLYIVATPADVPDRVHVTGERIFWFKISDVDLLDVRTFVTRDLAAALAPWFPAVYVVDDASKLPATRHVRAEVKLAKVAYERRVSAGDNGMQKNEHFAALEWAFALRPSERPDFVFSFADRAVSPQPLKDFDDTSIFPQVMKEALRRLVAEWQREGAAQKLIAPVARAN